MPCVSDEIWSWSPTTEVSSGRAIGTRWWPASWHEEVEETHVSQGCIRECPTEVILWGPEVLCVLLQAQEPCSCQETTETWALTKKTHLWPQHTTGACCHTRVTLLPACHCPSKLAQCPVTSPRPVQGMPSPPGLTVSPLPQQISTSSSVRWEARSSSSLWEPFCTWEETAHALAGSGQRSSWVKERTGTFQNSRTRTGVWTLPLPWRVLGEEVGSSRPMSIFWWGGALVAPSGATGWWGEVNRELA